MFGLFKRKPLFPEKEQQQIVEAVRAAEQQTSGEIRVFIESRCRYMDALDRAAEIFFNLQMDKTKDRNGVLLYIAIKDRQLAVFGDEGIHNRVGTQYWNNEVNLLVRKFNKENYAEGIRDCVTDIGEALHKHFPYDKNTDKNELPDNIVFGK